MNKLLPNLVMVFALVLCALCLFQWRREGTLRNDLSAMNDDVYKKKETIQGLEVTLKDTRQEVTRLEGVRKELTETRLANEKRIAELTSEADRLIKVKDGLEAQLERYKEAIDTANESIRKQNEDIKKQNELLKAVVEQRDQKAAEVNKIAEDYNKLVGEYNKLAEDVKKVNEAIAAANAANEKKK